ncbi:hypothetical protein CARUB_v10026617mg [Capsella rubella]|uniref:NB-ARC domain-containing protein n=1 Tax=Capsella rubella TaxID=81985 RepID=R0GML7_9BRAS|nr:probable disease resistance protein At5g45440 [Capsella rubella]EOA13555.1 hypothetical protein CARUB_v10026617mg [Capsella rubella]
MAPEISRQREAKGTFTKNFHDQYEKWVNLSNEESSNSPKTNHLCAGALKNREKDDEEDRVETDSKYPGQVIHGFDNEITSLKNFLLDQKVYKEFKSLVIVGEYGVGKTTLCKMIFNDTDVRSVYAPRIWVSMHSNESKEGLDGKICVLTKILKGLGVEDSVFESIHREVVEEDANRKEAGEFDEETAKEDELSALLYALHLNLRWKKYLIVFDDVREEDNWNEILQHDAEKLKKESKWGKYLSDGFPNGSGGRVIYTTRDEKYTLAKKLVKEEHEIHRLWPLTDTGSVWNIYKEALEQNEETPPRNDKKCLDELMNKSRGLPLAARLLATLLPVFLDDEKADPNGSTSGTTESVNNTTSGENGSILPKHA